MTSLQCLDDLFWGRDHEDVTDWAERLTMAAEVRDLTPDKLFKIANVATLALGSRPRQKGVARVRAKRKPRSHIRDSRECRRV